MNLNKITFSFRERAIFCAVLISLILAYSILWGKKSAGYRFILDTQISLANAEIESHNSMIALLTAQNQIKPVSPDATEPKAKKLENPPTSFSKLVETLSTVTDGENIQVNRMAIDSNDSSFVSLASLAPGGIIKQQFYLELESSFIQIGKFLEKLETSELLAEIKSVELSKISSDLKKCTAKIYVDGYITEASGDTNAKN